MTAVTTLTALRSSDTRIYTKYPLGDKTFGPTDIDAYFFGNSLATHSFPPTATPFTIMGVWMGDLATKSALGYRGEGDFGNFAALENDWRDRFTALGDGQPTLLEDPDEPPAHITSPTYSFSENNRPNWSSGLWENDGYSHIYTMTSNFEMVEYTAQEYYDLYIDFQPPVDGTLGMYGNALSRYPNATLISYAHWAAPTQYFFPVVLDMTNLSLSEAQDYRDLHMIGGAYFDWNIEYQNIIAADYPEANYSMTPVGTVIMYLWNNEPYLQGLSSGVFFLDDAPHGSDTMYFLAALVCFRVDYFQSPTIPNYVPLIGSNVASEVLDNLPAIMVAIDGYLTLLYANGVIGQE